MASRLGSSAGSPLSITDIDLLTDAMTAETATAGTVLFNRHDAGNVVFMLERGRVALSRPTDDRSRVLQILKPGDIFGDVAVLLGQSAPVNAIALDDVELLTIDGGNLLKLLMTRPAISMRWMSSLAERLAATQDRLEELLAGPLDFQLAALLTHTADRAGSVAVSQETLAHLLGARRPSISRSLASLERQGLVQKHYRQIQITDPERLAALTN